MNVIITPSIARGDITPPPSKSYAHRLLICAALGSESSEIRGISKSDDMLATVSKDAGMTVGTVTRREAEGLFNAFYRKAKSG